MVRALLASIAAMMVLGAAPAMAQTVEWPETFEVSREDRLAAEAWAAQSLGWSNQHRTVTIEAFAWLGAINQGINTALGTSGSPSPERWGPEWAQQRRAALDALIARHQAIPAPPAPPQITQDVQPQIDQMALIFAEASARSRFIVDRARELAEPVLTLAERGGTATDARDALARAYYDLNVGLLEAENQNMADALAALADPHPNGPLALASIAMNLAMIEHIRWEEAVRFSEPTDAEHRAARIEQQAAEMRLQAAQARALAAAHEGALHAEIDLLGPTPQSAGLLAALATYDQSVLVEERIAASLDAMAAGMRAGDAAAVDLQMRVVMGFIRQRLQLDAQRRTLVAG